MSSAATSVNVTDDHWLFLGTWLIFPVVSFEAVSLRTLILAVLPGGRQRFSLFTENSMDAWCRCSVEELWDSVQWCSSAACFRICHTEKKRRKYCFHLDRDLVTWWPPLTDAPAGYIIPRNTNYVISPVREMGSYLKSILLIARVSRLAFFLKGIWSFMKQFVSTWYRGWVWEK